MKRWLLLLASVPLWTSCAPNLLGLDLNQPGDAKAYIAAGALGEDAMYYKAMLSVLASVSGPVTVIVPNRGDRENKAALEADLQRQGLTLASFLGSPAAERFARANIFAASKLSTGTMQTLDGTNHRVLCQKASETDREICTIDGRLQGWSHMEFREDAVGSVYGVRPVQEGERWYLPF